MRYSENFQGLFSCQTQDVHAKSDELANKLKADGGFVALGYQYPFSKTTRLYSALSLTPKSLGP